jgi:hypothetical protein
LKDPPHEALAFRAYDPLGKHFRPSKSNATSSQPERTEGCRSAPLDAPPLPGVRIIAEAAIFWAGRLKQAGKIRNVELRAGIFCKIKNRGANTKSLEM